MLKPIKHGCILPGLLLLSVGATIQAKDYEDINPEKASHYLSTTTTPNKPYTLNPVVENNGFINEYRLEGLEMGEFSVFGSDFAGERMHELEIIRAVSEIKQTDAFIQGFNASVDMTLMASEQMLNDPAEAMRNLEKGFSRFVDNIGATVSDLTRKDANQDEDETSSRTGLIKEFLGVNSARRRLAVDFDVDPYSSNQVLQKSLEDVAMAIVAGGASLDVALQSAPGAASAVRKTANMMEDGSQHYLHYSPKVLRFKIDEHLAGGKFTSEQLNEVLDNTECSLRHATTIAGVLLRLKLPEINQDIFSWALAADNENECRRRMHMMELAWDYRRRNKITSLWVSNEHLYWHDSLDSEGVAIVADHLFWTAELEKLLTELDSIYKVVWVSGEVSDRVASETSNRGIKLSAKRFKRLKGRENIGNSILAGSKLPELTPLPDNQSSEPRTELATIEQTLERNTVEPEPPVEEQPVETTIDQPAEISLEDTAESQLEPDKNSIIEEEDVAIEPMEQTPEPEQQVSVVTDDESSHDEPVVDEEALSPVKEESIETAVTVEKQALDEPVKPEVVRKTTKPGCWQHPRLGFFQFKQKGKLVELTHETPDRAKTRIFTLQDKGNRLFWSTNNVVHAFVRDLQGMRLLLNVKKGGNEAKLERCTE